MGARSVARRPRIVAGYIAPLTSNDQEIGYDTAEANPRTINQHSPWWYAVSSTANSVVVQSGTISEEVSRSTALQNKGCHTYPAISNHRSGSWTNDQETMLGSSGNRSACITSAVNLAVNNGYAGLDIDFEDTASTYRSNQSTFAADLGAALRAQGKRLSFTVHPKEDDTGYDYATRNGSQDYAALGAASDQLRIMAYDWNWQTAPNAGATAPIAWVDSVMTYAASVVDPDKVVLGCATWGYDWPINSGTSINGVTTGAANVLSYGQVQTLLAANSITPTWDNTAKSYWFRYTTGGQLREVWYEDAISLGYKLDIVNARNLGGVMFWRLGVEDTAIWPMVAAKLG